jgi:glyoxylase-like metal-dependent hydrolase (beta-lactamase superfamily II)
MTKRSMTRLFAVLAVVGVMAGPAAAQDARTLIGNAMKTMGSENLNSITFYGVAQNGNFGQNNNASHPWPLTNLNDYSRSIDFTAPASRATWQTYATPVTGGAPTLTPGQQNIGAQQNTWAQQLEIWTTPWGVLRAALANNATARSQNVGGRRMTVISFDAPMKSPGGQPYKVNAFVGPQGLVERVETWIENPIFGDMLVESEYTNYRDANGVMYPANIVVRRGGWPTFQAQILGINANPADIQARVTPPPPPGRAGGPGGAPGGAPAAAGAPGAGRGAAPAAPPPPTAMSEKLADGVWRIGQNPSAGAYNALAVEFADHIVLFEPGPANEARGLAIIAETKRVIPNKPIRYGVISHHHADHTGGIAAPAGEGIVIVTPAVNKTYLERALSNPRTLAPDSFSKSKRKAVVEGFTGDKRVFSDATRTFEIHVVKGLPHADGNVIGYLPKEKILVYADMFNLPNPVGSVPNPPVVGSGVFLDNIERLKLDVDRIMSVHSLNPDRMTTVAEIRASLGRK